MSRRTVLVVDDEADIRESLVEALREEGYQAAEAANGREAMKVLPMLEPPCAVILDIIMPVMSGNEVWAAMQADPLLSKIPVLFSTSDPSRAPAGALIMRKPVKLDRLLAAVASLF